MDPDQTASRGAVWSRSTLFAKNYLKSQADDKADDNCCGSLRVKNSLVVHKCKQEIDTKVSPLEITKNPSMPLPLNVYPQNVPESSEYCIHLTSVVLGPVVQS